MDPYKVLQVDPEAEDEVIQAAYRRLAQKYHPDVAGPAGAARMASLNAAWEILRDPVRRAGLDRERRRAAAAALDASARDRDEGDERVAFHRAARTSGSASSSPRSQPPAESVRADAHRPPETVSTDWTNGRSTAGSGYDPGSMRAADGLGAAGPPPGNPSGSVLRFGRYSGWSLGEIGRMDIDYLEWLDRMPIGRPYRDEIDLLLRRAGRRRSAPTAEDPRRGLFRRR